MAKMLWCLCVTVILLGIAETAVPNMAIMYDKSANLTCMNENINPDTITSQIRIMWLLPSGDLLHGSGSHERVTIFDDGKKLMVHKVDDVDFGIYTCLIQRSSSGKYNVVQKGLNLNGPDWGNLMDKYRIKLIVGVIAAAVVFVVTSGLCWYINRNSTLDEDERERIKMANLWTSSSNAGLDNVAVEIDETENIKKVPRSNRDSPPPQYDEPKDSIATKL